MNKKRLIVAILLTAVILPVVAYVLTYQPGTTVPDDAKDIAVVNIKQVNFDTFIDSNIVWVPGEKNSVAAVYIHTERDNEVDYTYHQETSVVAYNLGTGEITEVYNLWDYGVGLGNTINFFWSADGKRMVTGAGGVVNLETQTGHWITPPGGYRYLDVNVIGISPDGKMLCVEIWGMGLVFMNPDTGQYRLFQMDPAVFSHPLHPLAWSPDRNWIAVRTYDPDHPPKTIGEDVPKALYLLRGDGKEARLITSNIEGRIDAVTFSPDGGKLVWTEARNGEQYIYIANADGSGAHEIFSNANLPPEYNIASNLLWSSDGTRIVYVGPPDKNYNYPFWILTLGSDSNATSTP
jgi:WD40 repeat protein